MPMDRTCHLDAVGFSCLVWPVGSLVGGGLAVCTRKWAFLSGPFSSASTFAAFEAPFSYIGLFSPLSLPLPLLALLVLMSLPTLRCGPLSYGTGLPHTLCGPLGWGDGLPHFTVALRVGVMDSHTSVRPLELE